MNKNTRNILNWVLIAMLAMLPLRSVMAVDESACELNDEASQEVMNHDMHMMHMMVDDAGIDADESNDCCCCESSMNCASDCSIGTSASFIAQSAVSLPALSKIRFHIHVNNDLVFRDLAPPIRPPASL